METTNPIQAQSTVLNEVRQGQEHDPKKWKVAQDFETMFIQQMFQAMRKTVPEGELTEESNGRRIFTDMLDSEMSKKASKQGFGLAEIIYRQLDGKGQIPQVPQELKMPQSYMAATQKAAQQYAATPQKAAKDQVNSLIQEAANTHGIDPALLKALVHQESGGNSMARSSKGAMGLTQLMPATAKELGVNDPMDARQNVFGGALYLKRLLKRYGGDESKALAAYNAGMGNVDKYGGIPPFHETQKYVRNILAMKARNTEVEDAG